MPHTIALTLDDEAYERLTFWAEEFNVTADQRAEWYLRDALRFNDGADNVLYFTCSRHEEQHSLSDNSDCARNLTVKEMAAEVLAHISGADERTLREELDSHMAQVNELTEILKEMEARKS